MKKFAFNRENLSDVRVIINIMCIHVKKLLCQTETKQIQVLRYLLSGARGRL
jgi:hypothetical protein